VTGLDPLLAQVELRPCLQLRLGSQPCGSPGTVVWSRQRTRGGRMWHCVAEEG